MQEMPSYQPGRRTGCATWLAVLALLISITNFAWNLVQELAWDAAVEQATAGVAAPSQELQQVEPAPAQQAAAESGSTPVSPATVGLQYADVCGIDERNVTEVQLTQIAQQFAGREFTNWQGYVYDVQEREGRYVVQLADEPRGLFWSGNMVLHGVPSEVAIPLNVEQRVVFSGRIREVETSLGVICNPITIDVDVLTPQ
jgi:hypothetical protein